VRPGLWENQWQDGVAYGVLGVFIPVAIVLILVL
jgi:hypothetical protein